MKRLLQVLRIWLVVYLLITLLFYLLQQWLVIMPIYLRTLLLSGIMVFALQYWILPLLRKYSKS
ncbi:MAG: hypothetical protein AAF433_07190 [Bacteroidota bacterium]